MLWLEGFILCRSRSKNQASGGMRYVKTAGARYIHMCMFSLYLKDIDRPVLFICTSVQGSEDSGLKNSQIRGCCPWLWLSFRK